MVLGHHEFCVNKSRKFFFESVFKEHLILSLKTNAFLKYTSMKPFLPLNPCLTFVNESDFYCMLKILFLFRVHCFMYLFLIACFAKLHSLL